MFDFQKLEIYKKAKAFHIDCRALISKKNLDTYVRDQLGRASFSVILNVAEGSGKFSKADRRNFFTTSRASVFECVAILDTLKDMQVIDEATYSELLGKAEEISKILFAMIQNLK